MKKIMINSFISKCLNNNKIALMWMRLGKVQKRSFNDFYMDCLKMKSFYEQNVKENDKVLIFLYPYSYDFFVSTFAGFMFGLDMVVIDQFKDKTKIAAMVKNSSCNTVLMDNLSKFLSFKLPRCLKRLKVKYNNFNPSLKSSYKGSTITTFTSGTTGDPKPIIRDLEFLFKQVDLIKSNIKIDNNDIVYGMLPMYTMLSIFLENTTCISRKPEKALKMSPNVLLTPIKSILKAKIQMPTIKKCFLGGAILYTKEVNKILRTLPNADITYVYGASEGALIYKTTLKKYQNNPFSFDEAIGGIKVVIFDENEDGIGEVAIEGNTVISSNKYYLTGDYAKLVNNVLTIVGRKKYCKKNEGFYNYIEDEKLINENPKIKKAFTFIYNDKKYAVYEGVLSIKHKDINYFRFRYLPMDLKHNTKLDYNAAIKIINSRK